MKFILMLFFISISIHAFSQGDFDKRLLVKYSEKQLKDMVASHPNALDYWTYYLDNSYEIVELKSGKDVSNYPEIKFNSPDKFNVLALNVHMQQRGKTYFRIKNKNKLLVLDSNEGFIERFNAHRSNN